MPLQIYPVKKREDKLSKIVIMALLQRIILLLSVTWDKETKVLLI